ncbi:MAG TPA: DinB family protein [Thermoanaerobaculia bacterium]|nr:DinB family protein [Thermoanaerobaculia bacterium]
MKKLALLFVGLVLSVPALAQEMMPAPAPGAVATLKANFNFVSNFNLQAAEEVPESEYAFKPTPVVRSFGQIIGHIADANYLICSTVLGEKNPSPGVEKTKKSKADLVAALKASYKYCDAAFSLPDKDTGRDVVLFGQKQSRLSALVGNIGHNWEHYGNIVTYMRMKGHVPPSSRPRKP